MTLPGSQGDPSKLFLHETRWKLYTHKLFFLQIYPKAFFFPIVSLFAFSNASWLLLCVSPVALLHRLINFVFDPQQTNSSFGILGSRGGEVVDIVLGFDAVWTRR
jgi:hypothetical protein